MMKKKCIKRKTYMILTGIILFQVVVCLFYASLKKGYFVDELWGAGLANSYFRPRLFFPDVFNTNKYVTGDFFRDYLTVSDNEGFNIASVWYNQSQDSHPPFYFLLYHALSCLNPGEFSKWTGFIINVVFFVFSNVLIYKAAYKLTEHAWIGIMAVALWGFSTEVVSYTICARMYMMAAFFTMSFVYQSIMFLDHHEDDWRNVIYLLLSTVGGCLTHYYFYIAAFVMALITCLSVWITKGFGKTCKFGFNVLGGVFLSWAIYPQIFESLAFGDGRGREAVANIMDFGDFPSRIEQLMKQIENKLLYRPVLIIVLIALALIVLVIFFSCLWKDQLDFNTKKRVYFLLMIELTFVLYILIVAKIQPFYTNRYYFPATPLLWIVVVGNISIFAQIMGIRYKQAFILKKMMNTLLIIIFMISAMGIIKGHLDRKVMFLFPQQDEIRKRIQRMDKPPGLFIIDTREYTLTAHCLELLECSEVLCIDLNNESDLSKYEINDTRDSMIVFADERLDQQKLIDQVLRQTSYHSSELIGRGSGVWWENAQENYIYCFSKD